MEIPKTAQDLKEDRLHYLRKADELLDKIDRENRGMTADEKAEVTQLQADAERCKLEIEALEERDAQRAKTKAELALTRQSTGIKSQKEQPLSTKSDEPRIEFYRSRSLKSFKGDTPSEAEQKAYRSGQFIRAAFYNDARARQWCQNNGVQFRFGSETVNSAGGVLVPEELSQAIIDLREDFGVFRKVARIVPMGRDTMPVPRRAGGPTVYAMGEGTPITESQKTWNMVQLTARKLGILTGWSSELDADAIINIADDMASEMAAAFAEFEDRVGFTGTGIATDASVTGVITKIEALGTSYWCAPEAVATHDTFAELTATDIGILMSQVQPRALRNAKFICSSVCNSLVFDRLKAAGGGNTIQTLSGGTMPSYLGYPIVVCNDMPVSTASLDGKVMILFGDMDMAATLGDRKGIELSRSTEYGYAEDLIFLRGIERVDINVHDLGGLLATGKSTLGPIAGLIGNVA